MSRDADLIVLDKIRQRMIRWPEPLDLRHLATVEPDPPGFIIEDWLPAGYATLFAGHGGVGKSGIALYLACCIAMGLPFFGVPVKRRRVLYLSCEDRESVLHWRLRRICDHLDVDMAELFAHLMLVDLVGEDTVLWTPACMTNGLYTPAMGELRVKMAGHAVEGLFVDGVSDVFGGNENDRAQVKHFAHTLLLREIDPVTGFLVLLGHVPKPSGGRMSPEGYSGSTQWHNAVRARWYLYPEKTSSDDGSERTGALLLELQKSNLGRTDLQSRWKWSEEHHLFVGEHMQPESHMDRRFRESTERDGILAAFDAVAEAGEYVPAATTGNRTALHVLKACPAFPRSLGGGSKAERVRFWRHIEGLRAMRILREGSIRRKDRHHVITLERVDPEKSSGCGHAGNES